MKSLLSLLAFLVALTALAMPLKWVCNFPDTKAEVFRVYQGETVTFEPTFLVNGKAVDLDIEGVYIQTNGMAELWWKLDGNTFTPTNDVGAAAYRFFIQAATLEGGKNYHANGTLRMLDSPGFVPNTLPLPIHTLDFSQVEVKNAPWPDGTKVEEAIKASKDAQETIGRIEEIVLGDDCQLVSTNYDSKVHMPHLYLRFKIKDEVTGSNVWQIVWNEMTRWTWLLDEHLPANYFTKAEVTALLEQKADRAWGHYDSHTGAYAPEGFTWISSPQIALAANMAYQRVVTTGGAIFVLTSTRMTTTLGGDPASTNGFFRISDDKGNAIFEITKGSESIQPAMAGGITTETIDGNTIVRVPYNVDCPEHPKLYCTRSIDSHLVDWKAEDESGCPALVTWSGSRGAWMAEIRPYTPSPTFFVKATYKEGGKDIIKHYAPVELSTICIEGTNYPVNIEVMNGKKVLVLE